MQFFLQPLNGAVANYTQILLRNKGWSFSLIGVLLAVGQITTILGPMVICALAERKGTEKKALLICAALSLVFHIPVLVGSLAGGFIVDALGYTSLFRIYALFPFISLVLGLINRKRYISKTL